MGDGAEWIWNLAEQHFPGAVQLTDLYHARPRSGPACYAHCFMRLLVFSDIHGDTAALQNLMQTEAAYYFAAGDLVNWARGFEKVGPVLQARSDRVYVIPGNHESDADVARLCERYGLHNFHGQTMHVGGYTIGGLGYSNPTPFNTPGEYTEAELAARLAPFEGLSPLVMICHCPPFETKLDRAAESKHFGSTSIRDFIERNQPEYFFCGHIHEAAGASERLGATRAFNVGKKGYGFELPSPPPLPELRPAP